MSMSTKTIKERWSDLTIKEKVSYGTAVTSFCLGWILIGCGFWVAPVGEISGSVLSAFGMALCYCGSILGVSLHYSSELQKFKTEVQEEVRERLDE